MIPFVPSPGPLSVFGLRVPLFGALLFAGLAAAFIAMAARGKSASPARSRDVERFAAVVLLAAVLGAQAWGALREHGSLALSRPSLLLSVTGDLPSAAGALTGALAGAAYLALRRLEPAPFADLAAFAFPFGWLFARAGCALSHDHPGRLSTSLLAVRFPDGPRFDCGLLEWLATPLLLALVLTLSRSARRPGALAAAVGLSYGALRLALDSLRAQDLPTSDARLAGWTFAQWSCLPLLAASAWLAVRAASRPAQTGALHPESPPTDP